MPHYIGTCACQQGENVNMVICECTIPNFQGEGTFSKHHFFLVTAYELWGAKSDFTGWELKNVTKNVVIASGTKETFTNDHETTNNYTGDTISFKIWNPTPVAKLFCELLINTWFE